MERIPRFSSWLLPTPNELVFQEPTPPRDEVQQEEVGLVSLSDFGLGGCTMGLCVLFPIFRLFKFSVPLDASTEAGVVADERRAKIGDRPCLL